MTLFDKDNTNTGLEKNLKEKMIAGEIALKTNESINTNELVLLTIQTLEYIKRAFNEGRKEIYKDYVENNRFNESVQNLVYNSPPLINPNFVDIPLEEIPKKLISHYSQLMNIEDKGDHYEIDARDVAKTHFINEDNYNFYSTEKENPYSLGEDYRIGNNKIPVNIVFQSINGVRELIKAGTSYYGVSNMMSEKIIVPKNDLNYEAFMYLYELFYFDLFMKTFHGELLNTIEIFKNIQFVPKETEGAYTFDELSNYSLQLGTLQEFVAVIYYEYRIRREESSNESYFNCRLKNTPLKEVGFLFEQSDDSLIQVDDFKEEVLSDLYGKNIERRNGRNVIILEDKLNTLNKEFYTLYCKHLYEIIGIEDPLSFEYHTPNLTNKLYELADLVHDKQRDSERFNYSVKDNFGYLEFADEIKQDFIEKITNLNETINNNLSESEANNE